MTGPGAGPLLDRLAELKGELRSVYRQLRGPLLGRLSVLSFRVGPEDYAVHLEAVDRVTWIAQLEPVASAPAHLAGLLNLAGHMIPVLDLGRLLHNNDTLWTRYTPVILLAWADLRLGLITDELRDIEQLDIEPPDPLLPLPDWVVSCHPGPPARMLLDHGFLADSLHG